jgi:hypothetical protein
MTVTNRIATAPMATPAMAPTDSDEDRVEPAELGKLVNVAALRVVALLEVVVMVVLLLIVVDAQCVKVLLANAC